MEKDYKVIEIFGSIDGEGRRAGELTTFIRLSGCNLKCSWCDTNYSQDGKCGSMMSLEEILNEVQKIGYRNITVTGGEPLIHNKIDVLLAELSKKDYDVNVETNGSINPAPYIADDEHFKNVWFTIDYKSKSSGMQKAMKIENFYTLRSKDVIKFVVGNRQELEDAFEIMGQLENYWNLYGSNGNTPPLVYFSPVFGMIEPVEIVDFMKEKGLSKFVRVQLQLHKIIWDPNKRGV